MRAVDRTKHLQEIEQRVYDARRLLVQVSKLPSGIIRETFDTNDLGKIISQLGAWDHRLSTKILECEK